MRLRKEIHHEVHHQIKRLSMDVIMGEISRDYFEGKIRQLILDSIDIELRAIIESCNSIQLHSNEMTEFIYQRLPDKSNRHLAQLIYAGMDLAAEVVKKGIENE